MKTRMGNVILGTMFAILLVSSSVVTASPNRTASRELKNIAKCR
jgi:hypothetical protein